MSLLYIIYCIGQPRQDQITPDHRVKCLNLKDNLFFGLNYLAFQHPAATAAYLCLAQAPADGIGPLGECHLLACLGGLGVSLPPDLGALDGIQPGVAGGGPGHDPALPGTRNTPEAGLELAARFP